MISVKHIVVIARNSGQLAINPFAAYLEVKDKGFLNKKELKAIVNAKMKNVQYGLTRNLFVFSCFCGLGHSDAKNLTRDNTQSILMFIHR